MRDGIKLPDALGGPKASSAGLGGVLVNLDRQCSQAVIAQPGKPMASIRERDRSVGYGNSRDDNCARSDRASQKRADRLVFAILDGSATLPADVLGGVAPHRVERVHGGPDDWIRRVGPAVADRVLYPNQLLEGKRLTSAVLQKSRHSERNVNLMPSDGGLCLRF